MHATDSDADDSLARLSVQGSREAFGLLVARHARLVRAICLARIGARDVEDAVQEVFLRAYKGLGRLKDPGKFISYLGQIARNYCVDRLRTSQHKQLSLDEVELEPAVEPDGREQTERGLLFERLRREVSRLPESQREVLMLFYFEKMSYAQMAAALNVTEAAVNQRLSRARRQLRASFSGAVEGEGVQS